MSIMLDFISRYAHVILVVYLIGAVATFVVTAFSFIRGLQEDEREQLYLYGEQIEISTAGRILILLVVLVVSFLMAVLWIGVPVILGGIVVIDTIWEHYSNLMGRLNDNEEEDG